MRLDREIWITFQVLVRDSVSLKLLKATKDLLPYTQRNYYED